MTVHSFHIFDRKGKTLFTKRYVPKRSSSSFAELNLEESKEEEEQLSEQRKLVFGMLFSLRELCGSLSPTTSDENNGPGELQMVKTGSSTLYNYETASGLRFVLYTTPETSYSTSSSSTTTTEGEEQTGMTSPAVTANVRAALKHIYEHIWVSMVIRSPMYKPYDPDIKSTNFEASLDSYLKTMAWFK